MSFRDESKSRNNNNNNNARGTQQANRSKPKRNAFAEASTVSHHIDINDFNNGDDDYTSSPTSSANNDMASVEVLRKLVTSSITYIQREAKYFDDCEKKLGTDKDTKKLRDDLKKHIAGASKLVKETAAQLKGLTPPKDPEARRQFDKLKRELNECFANFNQLQKIQRMEKEVVLRERANVEKLKQEQIHNSIDEEELTKQQEAEKIKILQYQQKKQDMAVIENQIAHNEKIILEREEDILEIEQDIGEILQTFKEMNVLVKTQQVSFDLIENNVEDATHHVKEGNVNLEKANTYDKRGRNLACIILLIVLGLAVVAAIVLVVVLKSVHIF